MLENLEFSFFIEAGAVTSIPDSEDGVLSIVVESPLTNSEENVSFFATTCGDLERKVNNLHTKYLVFTCTKSFLNLNLPLAGLDLIKMFSPFSSLRSTMTMPSLV